MRDDALSLASWPILILAWPELTHPGDHWPRYDRRRDGAATALLQDIFLRIGDDHLPDQV